jgi:hypothetical protein
VLLYVLVHSPEGVFLPNVVSSFRPRRFALQLIAMGTGRHQLPTETSALLPRRSQAR